jgi:hypothetical protein
MRIIAKTEKYEFVELSPHVRNYFFKHDATYSSLVSKNKIVTDVITTAFPYIQILRVINKKTSSFYISCSTKPAMSHTDLCDLPLSNIYHTNRVCLKVPGKCTIEEFIDKFWRSSFNNALTDRMTRFAMLNEIKRGNTAADFYKPTFYSFTLDEILNKKYHPNFERFPLRKGLMIKQAFGELEVA